MYSVLMIYVATIAIHRIITLSMYLPLGQCMYGLPTSTLSVLLYYTIYNCYYTRSRYVWYYLRYTDTGHRTPDTDTDNNDDDDDDDVLIFLSS